MDILTLKKQLKSNPELNAPYQDGILRGETSNAKDLLGRTYEYCIAQFAAHEGTKGGEFYTPSSILTLPTHKCGGF